MSEPARVEPRRAQLEVRVGSATNALQPIPGASRSLAAGAGQWVGLGLVAVAAAVADQLTKVLVGRLDLGDGVDVVGPFTIHHVRNTGIAFGLFSDSTSVVIALTALAICALLVFFARSGARHPLLPVAVGLVLGGSASNLADRLRLGYVTDFLDLDYWPAFNLADTFIVVGVGLLFLSFVAADRVERHCWNVTALAFLSPTRAGAWTPSSPICPESGLRTLAERLVTRGAVLVDGRPRPKSHRLAGGEELDVELPVERQLVAVELGLEIVHADEHVLVVESLPASSCIPPAPRSARPWCTGCSASGRRAATRSGRGSSTVSTATRRGSSSSRGLPRRTNGCPRRSGSGASSGAISRSSEDGHVRARGGSPLRSAATGATGRGTR